MGDNSWPELQEELSRKVTEKLDELIHQNAHGEITDHELVLITQGIYDCITGLVPWDVANLLYEVRQALEPVKRRKA